MCAFTIPHRICSFGPPQHTHHKRTPKTIHGLLSPPPKTEILTTEDLQRLEACLPTAQELKTVLAYTGPAAALGPAETFFRALGDTPRVGGKVTAMLFSRQFLGSVAGDAEARVGTLSAVSLVLAEMYWG